MSTGAPATCVPCKGNNYRNAFVNGVWAECPIPVQILGICSCLAVTNKLKNALVMGSALIFVTAMSNLFVSLVRNKTPRSIRMIAELAIISAFVIVFDQFLKVFAWDVSKQLGPYVGLIITNCIVMGRAEAFALSNPPLVSTVDGAANGLGYAIVLAIIGTVREPLGTGNLLGYNILSPAWYTNNQLMVLAPGAFFALGFLIVLFNAVRPKKEEPKK